MKKKFEEAKRLEEIKKLEQLEEEKRIAGNKIKTEQIISQIKSKWKEDKHLIEKMVHEAYNTNPDQNEVTDKTDTEDQTSDDEKEYNSLKQILIQLGTFRALLSDRNSSVSKSKDIAKLKYPPDSQKIIQKKAKIDDTDVNNGVNKFANELTVEAVKKNIFFKIVKGVVGSAPEKDDKKKYSQKDVTNKLAQIKFIQKCKEENVLALPMLNRLKDKKLILSNYRMNNGIAKALKDAIKELS